MSVEELEGKATLGRRFGNAQNAVALETLQEIQYLRQTMTDWAAKLSGRMINKVLQVGTYTFPASGEPLMFEWGVAAGAIRVTPLGAGSVTVSTAPAESSAPTSGVGVSVVLPANPDTIAIASTVVTLYGTIGQSVSIQVFAAGITP